jgi:hypothetical protein
MCKKALLSNILRFCKSRKWSRRRFGVEAMSDPAFVYDLENGKEPTVPTYNKIKEFIRDNAKA